MLINLFSQNFHPNLRPKCHFFLFVRKQNAFYGQTDIFNHFVRNRHFSSRPITDRRPIFIDVSVIGSDFSKYGA